MPAFSISPSGKATANDLPILNEPGAPQLPYYSTLIALPPEATANIQLTPKNISEQTILEPSFAPYPVSPAIDLDGNTLVDESVELRGEQVVAEYYRDPAIYDADAYYPQQRYTLSEPMYYRDLRVVRLTIFPFRYNPQTQALQSVAEFDVSVTFEGADFSNVNPLNNATNDLSDVVVNATQAEGWRSLPSNFAGNPTALPVGQDTYKIEVNEDGIYEVSGATLAAKGMNIASVNPSTLQMNYRGDDVAFEFVDINDNGVFESNDSIRFYGWKFDGARTEAQYITNNVYWIWANGTATNISDIPSPNGLPTAPSYRATVISEPESYWTGSWIHNWEDMPNEADAWYMARQGNGSTANYPLNLTDPAPTGANATFSAELLARASSNTAQTTANVTLNGNPTASDSVTGKQSFNVTGSATPAQISETNNFQIFIQQTVGTVFVNTLSIEYQRLFIAENNQLQFSYTSANTGFEIDGFSTTNPVIWNITNRLQPQNILGNSTGTSGNYTYSFGSNNAGTFFVTNENNLNTITTAQITKYTPPSLAPSGNTNVDWLAISHTDFLPHANQLATHRQKNEFGNHNTFVVNAHDVIQQYGFGLPTPNAFNQYLAYTLANWNTPPKYVVLFGDSTINPRRNVCVSGCSSNFNNHETNFLPTAISFTDRFNGLAPSDAPHVLVVGNDLIPDFAIGRIPVQTSLEAQTVVNKIILYEQSRLTPQPWHNNILFVADEDDDSGNKFCAENHELANIFPNNFTTIVDPLCLPDEPTQTEISALRSQMSTLTSQGASILNYRGHGSIPKWGQGETVTIANVDDTTWWTNADKPFVLISADCLDGYFALPSNPALSESFLKGTPAASAAHWSSSGLGFTYEHTLLEEGFYNYLFANNDATIGDAINFAKQNYLSSIGHTSLIYSFNLLGDPAMVMFEYNPSDFNSYLPVLIK